MPYIALYRKWRPTTFRGLVGQEHIAHTLSNAITSGRIGHAYLFSGPRGTGKTSTAKIFAKALNCEHGPTPAPCNECRNCQKINDGSSMDVFEIDAASNRGIDEIRDLRETVKFAPVDGRYKVYIIDEVHMLTSEAFNALLKTLEEPPGQVVFILATTEIHKVPATIQSRCQRYDFRRITVNDIEQRLAYIVKETGAKAEDEALALIAVQADGGMRDALSILDQCIALSGEKGVTADLVRQILGLVGQSWMVKLASAIASADTASVLSVIDELVTLGKDLKQVVSELLLHFRSIMLYQAAGTTENMGMSNEAEDVLREQAHLFSRRRLMQMMRRLHDAMAELRWSPQPRITVEAAFLSLCSGNDVQVSDRLADEDGEQSAAASPAATIDDARIAQLEAKIAQLTALLANGAAPVPVSTTQKQEPVTAKSEDVPASHPAAAEQSAIPLSSALPVTADGVDIWKKLLDALKTKNMVVFSCVKMGEFRGMDDGRFLVSFKNSRFLKERTEKADYRKTIEDILAELAGKPLRLICTLDDEPMPPPMPKFKKKIAKSPLDGLPPLPKEEDVDVAAFPPEDQHVLQAAIDAFGDHFVVPQDEDMPEPISDEDAIAALDEVPPPTE